MIEKLKKSQGWETRLNAVVMRYYFLPYESTTNGCFIFMDDVFEALCGESPIREWRDKVPADKKEAWELYKKHAETDSREKLFQWFEPVRSYKMAQRGDVGIMTASDGTESFGVVSMNGRDFLIRAEDRDHLVSVKLGENIRLWRAA